MEDHETCSNCRRDIPSHNYQMHSMHCARNIALCPDCDEPIPRGELEEHKEEVHGLKDCPLCAEKIEACKLEDHQASMCSKRTTLCKFCATHVEMGNLTEHENYCGSRTDKCEQCGEFIMLKNFELHINSNHGFIKLNDEPGPKPSWEKKPAVKTSTSNYSSYTSQVKSSVSDPAPSTPSQRSNFTATELFNNQDLYSSRRYSTTNGLSSSASSSALSSVNRSSVNRSSSSSIVSSALNKSTSSSRVAERRSSIRESTLAAETRRSSIRDSTLSEETRRSSIRESTLSNGVSTSKSTIVGSVLDKHATSIANAHVNGQLKSEGGTDGVMLPCEFCEKMIPMYKLLSHQAECVNPSNVRGPTSTSYNRYSSTSAASAVSVSRSASLNASLNAGSSSSMINKYLRQPESDTPPSSIPKYSSNGNNESGTSSRKISPTTNSSIVNRYIASPEPKTNGHESQTKKYLPESPPSYEKQDYTSHYTGRSSYLKEESRRDSLTKSSSKTEIKTAKPLAPGMYDNDDDREGLRQMLSSMRRDPMEVADDPDNNDGSFFPCEFCGDPYPCEFLMRHQMSCDLNPVPVSSGSGFDYTSIKKSIGRNLGLPEAENNSRAKRDAEAESSSKAKRDAEAEINSRARRDAGSTSVSNVEPETNPRESRRLSRSNSVIERSYSRSNIRASSVSRTSSFADRSYGTRTSLGRQSSFSIADYSSAVRRSSVFDGYAGYSIYSSISEGLDQITHGGRHSRRNSVSEPTNYSLSRQGSFSARNDLPLPALMASLEASRASKDEDRESRREKPTPTASANAHINGQASSYLQNGHHSHLNGYSRQHSQNDSSPRDVASPFGATNGHHAPNDIQKSESKILRRRSSLKHSQSGYKLERKVSFHQHDQIIIDGKGVAVDENGVALLDQPDGEKKKKKRTEEEKAARKEKKEKKEAKRREREMSKDRKCKVDEVKNKQHPVGGELFEQVSAKLHDIERERNTSDSLPTTPLSPVPSSSLFPNYNSSGPQASNKSNTASVANPKTTEPPRNTTANTVSGHVDVATADNKLTINSETVCRAKPSKGPAPQPPIVDNLVNLEDQSVVLREHNINESEDRMTCSKRNSLDNKSVQTLAKDLAAECAKAYELMESSLSKLTNDFSIGPFGLTPKTKKKYRGPPAPPLK
eukprot:GFUD01015337.1.p1 GENE.GFUD01015337.1~~GFUD01015337.1.p1  ORF type:complete len:1160 (-),score=218.81 GFUD01015337.1:340-3819(-)